MFRKSNFESRLTCLGDKGKFLAASRVLRIRPTPRIRPAVLCPDQFLEDFLRDDPRYRFSADKQTLELRNEKTGERLLLSRL